VLGACSNTAPAPSFLASSGNSPERAYRLGTGDKLKITVFGEDDLSGPAEVTAQGTVVLPLAGEIEARGQTLGEFRNSVSRRLADGYIRNPKVTIEITNYRPIYVHGEVKSGGEFQYKNGLNLRDAVAMAGGYTYRADQSYVYISRNGQPEAALGLPTNIVVLPGDNIRVPERFF
jgi:polysaccharide export outer membrane protein